MESKLWRSQTHSLPYLDQSLVYWMFLHITSRPRKFWKPFKKFPTKLLLFNKTWICTSKKFWLLLSKILATHHIKDMNSLLFRPTTNLLHTIRTTTQAWLALICKNSWMNVQMQSVWMLLKPFLEQSQETLVFLDAICLMFFITVTSMMVIIKDGEINLQAKQATCSLLSTWE